MKKNRITCFLLIFALILCFSGCSDDNGTASKYKTSSKETSSEDTRPDNPIDFAVLKQDCADVVGWITVPDTVIDYPILQSGKDKEDDYYMSRDMHGKYLKQGEIIISRANSADFSDPNTVIGGHNMMSGAKFGTLKKFRNKKYFNAHRSIRICIPNHVLEYEIVSAFVYDDRSILNSFNFFQEEEYARFISTCLNPKSLVKNVVKDAEIKTTDRIITLLTCTSNFHERYLVIGKLISDTETKN